MEHFSILKVNLLNDMQYIIIIFLKNDNFGNFIITKFLAKLGEKVVSIMTNLLKIAILKSIFYHYQKTAGYLSL